MPMQQLSVEGVDRLVRELRVFDREALRELYQGTTKAMERMSDDARGRVPGQVLFGHRQDGSIGPGYGVWRERKSGRDLAWSSTLVQSGLKKKSSIKKSRAVGGLNQVQGLVQNTTAQGAIFMLAGSRNPSDSSFTREVITRAGRGPWPRLLGPAWSAHVDQARDDIGDAIRRAADKVGR